MYIYTYIYIYNKVPFKNTSQGKSDYKEPSFGNQTACLIKIGIKD